jgi:hypothetical protein
VCSGSHRGLHSILGTVREAGNNTFSFKEVGLGSQDLLEEVVPARCVSKTVVTTFVLIQSADMAPTIGNWNSQVRLRCDLLAFTFTTLHFDISHRF